MFVLCEPIDFSFNMYYDQALVTDETGSTCARTDEECVPLTGFRTAALKYLCLVKEGVHCGGFFTISKTYV